MKGFLTVGEFAELSGISIHTLRYWNKTGLFLPAKRDEENNYRYYTPDQITAVNFISVLNTLEVPFKIIKKIEDTRDPESIIDLIVSHEKYLNKKMRRLCEAYEIIHTRHALIRAGIKADPSEISVQELDEEPIILGPPTDFKTDEPFFLPVSRFLQSAPDSKIDLNFPVGGYYESMGTYLKSPSQPDRWFSMDPAGSGKIAEGEYLVGYNCGRYGEFGDLPQRMEAYGKAHSLTFDGPLYAIYLFDEICTNDPSQYLVRVSAAVKK